MKFLAILILVPMLFFTSCGNSTASQSSKKDWDPEFTALAIQRVNEMKKNGAIKIEPELNKVYVDPQFWNMMNVDVKNLMLLYFAAYLDEVNGKLDNICRLFDYNTGKQIASYDYVFGTDLDF